MRASGKGIARLGVALAVLALATAPGFAQQSTVSALAAEGYEVKAMTTFDLNTGDDRSDASIFVIMQRDADVYGCALRSATSSFCQRIE